jgi:hypothetical protein
MMMAMMEPRVTKAVANGSITGECYTVNVKRWTIPSRRDAMPASS